MKIDFFLIVLITQLILINNEKNYLKLIHCLRNSESIKNTGKNFIKDSKIGLAASIFDLWRSFKSNNEIYKFCEKESNDSFEYDAMCVIKCLNKFKYDYDYSCFASCYY